VTPTKKPFHEELGGLFLHVPLAVFGGALAAIVLGGVLSIVFSSFGIRILSRGDIYNPFLWLPAVFLGLVANRLTRHRSACFVGAIGFLFLLAIVL